MELSTALQVALFLASVTFIVVVICLIPIALQVWRRLEQLANTAEQLKSKVEDLVVDSRELVRNVDALSKRVNQQMDEVGHVLHTAREWTDRADRVVTEVGSAIEPTIYAFSRNLSLLRTVATAVVQAFLSRRARRQTNKTGE